MWRWFCVGGSVCGPEDLVERNREVVAELIEHHPGGFHACTRCGWVRYVPFSSRQLRCLFPGKQGWRCGVQLTQAGWALSEEIPADGVAARNEAVRQAFRAVQEEREAPADESSRLEFQTALRAATRPGGEVARRGRRKAAVGLRPLCLTLGCTARSAPKGRKCLTCRYLAKKEGEKRLQEEAHERRQHFLSRHFAKKVSEKGLQEEAKEALTQKEEAKKDA